MSTADPASPTQRSISASRLALAALLLAPAGVACALTQLWPTFDTLLLSTQDVGSFSQSSAGVGFDNYAQIFENDAFQSGLLFSGLLVLARVLAVAVVPPALGWALTRARGGALLRALATAPMAFFAPGAVGLACVLTLFGLRGLGLIERFTVLQDPVGARILVIAIDALAALVFGVSAGVIVFGAAARSTKPGRWLALAWLGMILASAALAWQVMDLPFTLTGGGPGGGTATPLVTAYRSGAQLMVFGPAAAATTLVLVPILGVGLSVGLGLALARPRLEPMADVAVTPSAGAWPALAFGGAVAALAGLALALAFVAPLVLSEPARGGVPRDEATTWFNTLVPPLVGLVIQWPLALLGGYAIGGLRPLGRHSLWLLVPFAPWLFVTPAAHALNWLLRYQGLGLLGNWATLVPPGFSVAALTLMALTFFGVPEAAKGRERLLPWVAALAGALVWLSATLSDFGWQYLLAGPRETTWLIVALQAVQRGGGLDPSTWLALLAPTVLIGLALTALAAAFGARFRIGRA